MLQALAVVFLVLSLSIAQAETPAEVAAQAELVADLEASKLLLDAEIRELGNGRDGAAAAAGLAQRMDILEEKIVRMTEVSEVLAESRDDLDRLKKQVADEPIFTLKDIAEEGAEEVVEEGVKKALEWWGKQGAKKAVGPASLIGDAFEYVGKYVIRELNEREIRDMVRRKEMQLIDVLRLINTLRHAQNDDRQKLRRVQELRRQQARNLEDQSRERAKLNEMRKAATADANVERFEDPEGDNEVRRELLRTGVRLCDPSQKPKPQGVRPASAKPADPTPPAKTKKDGELISELPEDATPAPLPDNSDQSEPCIEIAGHWLMNWANGRGPFPAEIIASSLPDAAEGTPVYYQMYMPDQATAAKGEKLRCVAQGYELQCQVRVEPSAQCSGVPDAWDNWAMTVTKDTPQVSGSFSPTLEFNVTDCAFQPFAMKLEFGFSLMPVEIAAEVSAK